MLLSSVLIINNTQIHAYSRYSRNEFSRLNSDNKLDYLKSKGLKLPSDFDANREITIEFIDTYMSAILEGKFDENPKPFNYDQSNILLRNLKETLEVQDLKDKPLSLDRAAYVLQDSTALGSWFASYANYNCYAYSLNRNIWQNPGDISGKPFSLTKSVQTIANNVLSDLEAMGYWGYTTTTKPNVYPDPYFRVIALRKAGNTDYHFMKPYTSLNSWAHKPGWTLPLIWKYSSPGAKNWTNEATAYNTVTYAPSITYSNTIIYILYKSYSDPGIQPWSIDPVIYE